MASARRQGDALDRWLRGDGRAALDGLLGGALDVIGIVDRDLNVRYVNWATPGLERESVIGKSALELMPPGYREPAQEVFARTLQTGVGESFETLYREKRRVLVWNVRVGPIRHENEVIGLVTINTDVTEQRQADIDRDRFFALSLDMLVVGTRAGLLKRVNPAFAHMLGYEVAELKGKPFLDFIHPDDRAHTVEVYSAVRQGLAVDAFENRCRRRDGTYRVLSWRGAMDPLTGDVYSVARDVTEQRATELQLRQSQKMEAVGKLAGGIAHDFNNLMQAVLGNVELALLQAPPPAVLDALHEIEGAGRRAAELTKQLLLFSRRQPLHPVLIDLNELLESLIKLLRRLLPENIAIAMRRSEQLWAVSADPTQLEQVVVNLCVNARDAMESGGSLSIATDNVQLEQRDCELSPWARPGRFVRLSISDTGAGMSAEVRERAFEPFFTTKSSQGGTGLGLATVYGIVQQHGGLVHVYSEPSQGTTIKVYLPADERSSQQPRARAAIDTAALRGHETILVAEDAALVRRPVIQLLESAGYRTLTAASGLDAIRVLSAHPSVDLALLDMVMPELSGPQAWERMRQIRPGLRVIFTSGYADDRYRELLPEGAVLLEKPFRSEDLLRAIRTKLDA